MARRLELYPYRFHPILKEKPWGGKRLRKIGIVALARKLLIALWRYLEDGVIPAGAQLKPVSAQLDPASA